MKNLALVLVGALVVTTIGNASDPVPPTPTYNPAIDMQGYLRVSNEAAKHRETRRVSEAQFLRMSHESGTIILDARSQCKYDLMHIEGAIHLNFSDITVESLKKVLRQWLPVDKLSF